DVIALNRCLHGWNLAEKTTCGKRWAGRKVPGWAVAILGRRLDCEARLTPNKKRQKDSRSPKPVGGTGASDYSWWQGPIFERLDIRRILANILRTNLTCCMKFSLKLIVFSALL